MTRSTFFEITWACSGLFADALVIFKWEIVGVQKTFSSVLYRGLGAKSPKVQVC